ncbi:sigma-70 family RNA polymerase sigma factor [Paraclostridium bifermentans]|uniref:sigma-70 family RNA polymerase sigma factor n=1 Tax=Paraclostridium bifermentans TaxID=1490 RepID=UPI0011582328|nr:sigma-70 family RNA polymerase sigma factor [Paraclostridium bifermentans]TQO55981.1 sigma-70 family RNA polymerase sigma factor [Paraclostridium bifermentans]GKZ02730.1 DNA-directed RNA polymerase sigma-70 factor [Paraclostridium bifermentans]GKZ05405.1 DNA-directed RNA polymerase sigma-70 factor [Paraclostridium bifermentans]GKZ11436.1 DNA-directed RNA polymerase sigma-70 factor [Paraclostridium bifermentans]
MKDKLIIKYIKKKNQKGMEILIDQYNGLITSVIRYHLGSLINYEEECVSDTLLAIWDNVEGFDQDKNTFKNWICAIAKYKAIDYKRKYLNKIEISDLDEQNYYIDKNLLKIEIQEELNETLKFLSEEDKEIFKRYYLNDESVIDIANDKKLAISSVHSKLSRGKAKIRKSLLNEGGK